MSEEQERNKWHVDTGRLGSMGMYAVVDDATNETVARVLEEYAPMAQQIADDHNRIPQLEQALTALVEAACKVPAHATKRDEGLELDKAIEQALRVLNNKETQA